MNGLVDKDGWHATLPSNAFNNNIHHNNGIDIPHTATNGTVKELNIRQE
jgi:hypothetical protein